MTDLIHRVAMEEHALFSHTSNMLALADEPWFLNRLNEEEIIAAIERLQVILVKKRQHKRQAA